MTHDSDTFDWQNLANLVDVLSVYHVSQYSHWLRYPKYSKTYFINKSGFMTFGYASNNSQHMLTLLSLTMDEYPKKLVKSILANILLVDKNK